MEVLFFVGARPGSPMLLLRKLPYFCLLQRLSLQHRSDVFIIWARCKWDGKVRGFILDKARRRVFKNAFMCSEGPVI